MNISETTEPRSDQQNYDDYLAGSRTVTITEVRKGSAEQPVEVHLAEYPGRPFKPNLSMRRVLQVAWGKDTSAYAGRRMTLYGDPDVKFGGQTVGGVRISHLSDIDGPLSIRLTVTRGKRKPYVVQPLDPPKDVSGRDWLKELAVTNGDVDAIKSLGVEARAAHASEQIMHVIAVAYKDATAIRTAAAHPMDEADPDYIAPEEDR